MTRTSEGSLQPSLRFARDEETAGENLSPRPEFPQVIRGDRRPVVTGEHKVDSSFGITRLPIGGGGQAEMTSANGGTPDNPAGVA